MDRDIVVLGATRAACEAALEAARRGFATVLVPAASGTARGSGRLEPRSPLRLAHEALAESEAPGMTRARTDLLAKEIDRRSLLNHRCMKRELEAAGVEIDPSERVRLSAGPKVQLSEGRLCRTGMVVVATGCRPRRPSRFPFDDQVVCDSDSVLRFDVVPRNLLIVGAEAPGCELACLFASLGSRVTVVDRRSRCLRYVDRELLERLHAHMQRAGIEIVLGEGIAAVERRGEGSDRHAVVQLESGRFEVCDRVAIVAGLVPNHDEIGLDELGVELDAAGFVVGDECGRTSGPGVFAAGSVAAGLAASAEAAHGRQVIVAATSIAPEVDQPCPVTIHTIPGLAMVGLTLEMCARLDVPAVEATSSVGQLTEDCDVGSPPQGLLKLVANASSRQIVGVHAIGREAEDLIQLGTWLIHRGVTAQEIASAPFAPHCASEAYWIAAVRAVAEMGTRVEGREAESRESTVPGEGRGGFE